MTARTSLPTAPAQVATEPPLAAAAAAQLMMPPPPDVAMAQTVPPPTLAAQSVQLEVPAGSAHWPPTAQALPGAEPDLPLATATLQHSFPSSASMSAADLAIATTDGALPDAEGAPIVEATAEVALVDASAVMEEAESAGGAGGSPHIRQGPPHIRAEATQEASAASDNVDNIPITAAGTASELLLLSGTAATAR